MKKQGESFFRLSNKHFQAIIIGVIAFAIYANTIPNFLNIDDELIYNNHNLTSNDLTALKNIFTQPYYSDVAGNKYEYRPVVLVTYFFEFMLFGRDPHISHAINVIIFTATCVLLYYLLLLLFRNYDYRQMIALMTALLFAVHTIHTEAVASIKNRDELLSLLFALISWIFAMRFVDSKAIPSFLCFLFFFLVGLFSKQTSIAFAVLIPVSVILFRKITFIQLLALILPIALLSSIFSPVYLLYKKAGLFVAEIIFLILFYYFMSEREKLVGFGTKAIHNTKIFLAGIGSKTKRIIASSIAISRSSGFTNIKINSKLLNITAGTALIVVVAGFFISRREKSLPETIKQVQWTVEDRVQDFNELQVTPALQTPAPAVIPIAGRKLNFVEVPLLYVNDVKIKAATSIYVIGMYLKLMLVPYPLGFYYGYGQIPLADFSNLMVWYYLLLYVALFLLMIYLLITRKHLIAAFGFLFFIVSIFPLSNLLTPIAGIMAERLAYAASLGYCIAFSYFFAYPGTLKEDKILGLNKTALVRVLQIFFAFFIMIYSYATIERNFKWKDRLTLMRNDMEYLEFSARANHLLATHLGHEASVSKQPNQPENTKMLHEAVVHFNKALEIYPEFPYAWYDLAKTYLFLNDSKSAINAYLQSTKVDSLFAPTWFELGVVLSQQGRNSEAENAYRQAIKRDSARVEAYINLSYSYYQQDKYNESLEVCFEALRHNPNSYNILVNIGRIYIKLQDIGNALLYLEKAAAIDQSDKAMLSTMANLYQSIGNMDKANYYRSLQ